VRWLALLLLLAMPASATVVVRQVDVLDIVSGPTTNPLGMAQSDPFRYRVTSVQGTSVLSYVGSTAVTGLLTDVRLGDVVGRATGTINNAAGGEFTFYLTPSALLDVGDYYEFRGYVYGATGVIGTVAWDPVTMGGAVCSTCRTVVVVGGGIADGVGPVSNVTVGASNSWTAATGALVISSNSPPIGYGVTNQPSGTLWYTADGWLLSGTNDTASGISGGIDLGGNVISNGAARLASVHVGPDVVDSGSNNIALTGRATFGLNSKGNVALGNGITFGNTLTHSTAGGSNVTVNGSFAFAHGRTLRNEATYSVVMGADSAVLSGGTFASVLGGWQHTNAGASYASIGGGYRNTQGAGALYSFIPGGTTNQVDGIGGAAIGHSGYVPSPATNALIINMSRTRRTNGVPHSVSVYADDSVRIQVGGMVLTVATGTVTCAVGTGTLVYAESGLTVNGVVK